MARDARQEESPRRFRVKLSSVSLVTLVATLMLVFVGGYTRGSGSGYGCADRWPLCEGGALGGLLPRADYHMIIEWSHRWLAATVGVLVVATAVLAWRQQRARKAVVWPATAAVGVVGLQAWIGRVVVQQELDADLVSLHLAISMIVVGLLVVVTVNALAVSPATPEERTRDRNWAALTAVGAAGSYVLVLLGSYVHNRYVPGWPLVQNQLFPVLDDKWAVVHLAHRILAAAGLLYLVFLLLAERRRDRPRPERYLLWAALGCYAVNVGLGAAHVFTKVRSTSIVALHLLVAAVVWALLVATATSARRPPVGEQVGLGAKEQQPQVPAQQPDTASTPGPTPQRTST
ncbi:MAG: Heme A synthase [Acidimicrobiales bacterium]|nr:Heme A synthase [Acidimicrobiales bacterium]